MKLKKKTVIVMGGGTGTYTVLTALKQFDQINLKAIVAMTDDGGSSGVLRDELGVLPPGDIRQSLVALSESSETIRKLMNYRFDQGNLRGHSFGNIFLSALEKVTGSFEKSVAEVGRIIKTQGEIIPVTLDKVKLVMVLKNGASLIGERVITPAEVIEAIGIKKFSIKPRPRFNPSAKRAILNADTIILGPGNIYTSLIPLALIPGLTASLKKTKAKIILIVDLMTKFGQTNGFNVFDFVNEIEKFFGQNIIDVVVFNTQSPADKILKRYFQKERSQPILIPVSIKQKKFFYQNKIFFGGRLLANGLRDQVKSDSLIKRNLIRHDQIKLAKFLEKIIWMKTKSQGQTAGTGQLKIIR